MRACVTQRTSYHILLGPFSRVTLWTHDLAKSRKLKPKTAAWSPKQVSSSVMPSPRDAAKSGAIGFPSCPARAEIAAKIPPYLAPHNTLAHAA
jgi:hypothetical protein